MGEKIHVCRKLKKMHYQHEIRGVWLEGSKVTFLNAWWELVCLFGICSSTIVQVLASCDSQPKLLIVSPPPGDAVSLLTFIPITGPLIFIFASGSNFAPLFDVHSSHSPQIPAAQINSLTVGDWLDFSQPPITQHFAERFTEALFLSFFPFFTEAPLCRRRLCSLSPTVCREGILHKHNSILKWISWWISTISINICPPSQFRRFFFFLNIFLNADVRLPAMKYLGAWDLHKNCSPGELHEYKLKF